MDNSPSPLGEKAQAIAQALLKNSASIKKEIPREEDSSRMLVKCAPVVHAKDKCASCGFAVDDVKTYLALETLKSVGIGKPTWGQFKKEHSKGGSSASHAVIPQTILTKQTKELVNQFLLAKKAGGIADAEFWKNHFDEFWAYYKAEMINFCQRPVPPKSVAHLLESYEKDCLGMKALQKDAVPKPPAKMDLELTPTLGNMNLVELLEDQLQVPPTNQALNQVLIRPDDCVQCVVPMEFEEPVMEDVVRPKYVDDPNTKGKKIADPNGATETIQRPKKSGEKQMVRKDVKAVKSPDAKGHVLIPLDNTSGSSTLLADLFGPKTQFVTITRKNPSQVLNIHRKLPVQCVAGPEAAVPSRAEFLLDQSDRTVFEKELTSDQKAAVRSLNVVADAYATTLIRLKDGGLQAVAKVKGRVPSSEARYVWTLQPGGEKLEMYKDTIVNGELLHRKFKLSPQNLDRIDFTPVGEKVTFLPVYNERTGGLTRKVEYWKDKRLLEAEVEKLGPRKEFCPGVEKIFNNMESIGYFGSQCKLCEELQGDLTLPQRLSLLAANPKMPTAFVSDALLAEMRPGKGAAKGPFEFAVGDAEKWMSDWMDKKLKEPLQKQLVENFGGAKK